MTLYFTVLNFLFQLKHSWMNSYKKTCFHKWIQINILFWKTYFKQELNYLFSSNWNCAFKGIFLKATNLSGKRHQGKGIRFQKFVSGCRGSGFGIDGVKAISSNVLRKSWKPTILSTVGRDSRLDLICIPIFRPGLIFIPKRYPIPDLWVGTGIQPWSSHQVSSRML